MENQIPNTQSTDAMNSLAWLHSADIFQREKCILRNVFLDIKAGEILYLIGKTGTGKSSLLKTLYGDLPLKKGAGKVVNFDLTQLNWQVLPYLRRKLGIVFQDFQLLPDRNVAANLEFTLRATDWRNTAEITQRIDLVLNNVGLSHKKDAMPYHLSGGEQQRVSIARALLNEPKLIIADEPTGNLDPQTSEEIMGLLHQISKYAGTAVFIGTHDFYTLKKFPARTLVCENNRVVE